MRKVVFIILDTFADWEYGPLAAELASPDEGETFDVLFASDTKEPKTSLGNLKAMPDLTLDEIPRDADALILIGGNRWRAPYAQAVAPIAKGFLEAGKVVGVICDAARFLGANGLLENHNHTVNQPEELAEEPAYNNARGYQAQDVVRDGNLVTANGTQPIRFAREVLLALGRGEDQARQWYDFNTMGFHAVLQKYFPQG